MNSARWRLEAHPWAARSPVLLQKRRSRQHRSQLDQRRDDAAQVVELVILGAEDGAQDRVERDPHHRLERGEVLADRPRGHLGERLLFEDARVGAHALTVERRKDQATLAQVEILIEREDRVAAERSLERARVSGVEHIWLRGEDLLDQRGVRDTANVSPKPGTFARTIEPSLRLRRETRSGLPAM